MEGGCWCNFCPFDVFNGIRRVSSRRHSICRVRLMAAARGSRTRPGRMPRAAGSPDLAARSLQLDATRYDSDRLGSTWSISIYRGKRSAVHWIRDKLISRVEQSKCSKKIWFRRDILCSSYIVAVYLWIWLTAVKRNKIIDPLVVLLRINKFK